MPILIGESRMSQRPTRWSKQTDELVRYVAAGVRPALQSELGGWLDGRSRFETFVAANQDKIRKKLGTNDEENRLDVRSELLVAYAVLADRRFDATFEAYGVGRAGPDLTLTFRANQRLNLEVTRLRASSESATAPRLANVIAGKLRQLPGQIPNALLITSRGLSLTEETLTSAARLLRTHNESKDDEFFARRGFKDARDFHVHYLRLAGVFALDESDDAVAVAFLPNREARHPLPDDALAALRAALANVH